MPGFQGTGSIGLTLAEILYGIEKSPVKKKERRLKIERIVLLLDLYPFGERAQLEKEGSVG